MSNVCQAFNASLQDSVLLLFALRDRHVPLAQGQLLEPPLLQQFASLARTALPLFQLLVLELLELQELRLDSNVLLEPSQELVVPYNALPALWPNNVML